MRSTDSLQVEKKGKVQVMRNAYEAIMERKNKEKTENEKIKHRTRKVTRGKVITMTPGAIRKYTVDESVILREKRKENEKGERSNDEIDEKIDMSKESSKTSRQVSEKSQTLKTVKVQSFQKFSDTTPKPISPGIFKKSVKLENSGQKSEEMGRSLEGGGAGGGLGKCKGQERGKHSEII